MQAGIVEDAAQLAGRRRRQARELHGPVAGGRDGAQGPGEVRGQELADRVELKGYAVRCHRATIDRCLTRRRQVATRS